MFGFTTLGYEPLGSAPVAPLGPVLTSTVLTPLAVLISSLPIDSAILSTANSIDAMPIENVQTPEPDRVWRAGGHTPRVIIKLTKPMAINALAVMAHNGMPDATFRVQGGPTEASVNAIDAPTVDTASMSMWPASGRNDDLGIAHQSTLALFDNSTPLTYWSVEFNDGSNMDPFEAGRIMLDVAVRLKVGGQVTFQVSSKGDQRIGDFNRIFGDVRGPNGRKLVVPLNALVQPDLRKYILAYMLKHGTVKDFYFCADPTYDDDFAIFSMQCLFGDMTAMQRQLQYQVGGATWSGNLDLLEYT